VRCLPRPRRAPLVLAGAALVLVGAGLPRAAAAPDPLPAPTARTLILQLAGGAGGPTDGPVPALPRAERAARLRALLPTASTRDAVARAAGALGLTVGAGDAGSLSVSGPADLVDRAFPSAGGADARTRATRQTPPALQGLVALALDAADTTPVARPHAVLSGEDLTTAYAAPLPGGYPRTRPVLGPGTPVIASLQLSGWDPELLTLYAQKQVFTADPGYDPVAAGQYVGVSVDRAERFQADKDDDDGDGEVALDQQALLAAAPAARQRAYFGSNSAKGYLAVLNRVLADTVAGVPIVAFSTSWGACESTYGPSYVRQVEQVLERMTAAGVTLFAASGDDGTADCATSGDTAPAVDFPASSPVVLGVGGTTHPNGSGPALPDTAWSAPGRQRGSGGGVSTVFAKPSYQAFAGSGAQRQVPDLALPADITTGFAVYTADHSSGTRRVRGPDAVGGTSLSAPLAAGMLVDALVARGFPDGVVRGLGSIHRQLYAAPQTTPGAFHDVVAVGSNIPATIAPPAPGYDRATGLGTPDWSVLLGVLSAAPPAPVDSPVIGLAALTPAQVRPQLRGPAGVTVLGYYADLTDRGCTGLVAGARPVLRVPEGVRTLFVHALTSDLVCSPVATARVAVPTDDRKATRAGAWSLRRAGAAYAGTFQQASTAGAALTWRATGRTFRLLMDTGPDGGTAEVLVDGRVVRRLDASAPRPRFGVALDVRATRPGRHTIAVRVLGAPGRLGAGTTVRLDGLLVTG